MRLNTLSVLIPMCAALTTAHAVDEVQLSDVRLFASNVIPLDAAIRSDVHLSTLGGGGSAKSDLKSDGYVRTGFSYTYGWSPSAVRSTTYGQLITAAEVSYERSKYSGLSINALTLDLLPGAAWTVSPHWHIELTGIIGVKNVTASEGSSDNDTGLEYGARFGFYHTWPNRVQLGFDTRVYQERFGFNDGSDIDGDRIGDSVKIRYHRTNLALALSLGYRF